jgi:hypothetical protein
MGRCNSTGRFLCGSAFGSNPEPAPEGTEGRGNEARQLRRVHFKLGAG